METESLFVEAIKKGDRAEVEQLVDQQPDLLRLKLTGELSPALLALYYNEPQVAQFLVQRGTPLDIFAACGCGMLVQVQSLTRPSQSW